MDRRQVDTGGAKGSRKNERLCCREQRKRRKTTVMAEEGPQQPGPKETCSPVPPTQDDRSSAASGLDVVDRLTYLEQRMQMQEDEIQLLKMALADVLKRLNLTEEHQASATAATAARRAGGKARPVSLALVSRPTALKKSCTAPSSGSARTYSPTPSACSSVRSPPGSVKDSPCKTKTRPLSSTASSGKKSDQESTKPKEAAVTLGTRRVTHCKVTMQIYLSPHAKRTGCSEDAQTPTAVSAQSKNQSTTTTKPPNLPKGRGSNSAKDGKKKSNPKFTLNLQKSSTTVSHAQEKSSYQSPVKSPSQYFQICY
ncbi:unnamed protein product [Knipowitschia caucasica]